MTPADVAEYRSSVFNHSGLATATWGAPAATQRVPFQRHKPSGDSCPARGAALSDIISSTRRTTHPVTAVPSVKRSQVESPLVAFGRVCESPAAKPGESDRLRPPDGHSLETAPDDHSAELHGTPQLTGMRTRWGWRVAVIATILILYGNA